MVFKFNLHCRFLTVTIAYILFRCFYILFSWLYCFWRYFDQFPSAWLLDLTLSTHSVLPSCSSAHRPCPHYNLRTPPRASPTPIVTQWSMKLTDAFRGIQHGANMFMFFLIKIIVSPPTVFWAGGRGKRRNRRKRLRFVSSRKLDSTTRSWTFALHPSRFIRQSPD